MSQRNVDLAYQWLDAVNRRDLEAYLALMDEDVQVVSRIVAIEGGLHGHDGIRQWWRNWFDAFPDYHIELIEVRDIGDVTLGAFGAIGHGGSSRVLLEDQAWIAARWRNDKCVWWQVFYSEAEALEAVGLSE